MSSYNLHTQQEGSSINSIKRQKKKRKVYNKLFTCVSFLLSILIPLHIPISCSNANNNSGSSDNGTSNKVDGAVSKSFVFSGGLSIGYKFNHTISALVDLEYARSGISIDKQQMQKIGNSGNIGSAFVNGLRTTKCIHSLKLSPKIVFDINSWYTALGMVINYAQYEISDESKKWSGIHVGASLEAGWKINNCISVFGRAEYMWPANVKVPKNIIDIIGVKSAFKVSQLHLLAGIRLQHVFSNNIIFGAQLIVGYNRAKISPSEEYVSSMSRNLGIIDRFRALVCELAELLRAGKLTGNDCGRIKEIKQDCTVIINDSISSLKMLKESMTEQGRVEPKLMWELDTAIKRLECFLNILEAIEQQNLVQLNAVVGSNDFELLNLDMNGFSEVYNALKCKYKSGNGTFVAAPSQEGE